MRSLGRPNRKVTSSCVAGLIAAGLCGVLLGPAIGSTKTQTIDLRSFLALHHQSETLKDTPVPYYTIVRPLPPTYSSIDYQGPSTSKLAPVIRTKISLKPEQISVDIISSLHNPQLIRADYQDKIFNPLTNAYFNDSTPKLAIVIDDIGNNRRMDTRAAKLPGAVTLAILPHTPFSLSTAELGHKSHKDIMLHAPMESLNHLRLGDGALTRDLSEQQFTETLQKSIDAIPHVSGLNNHMGSALTQNPQAMNWVMQSAQRNNLFFVDSRTTPESVASDLARQYQIKHASRNIFLDNETDYAYIDQAFKRAIKISKKTGFALAIGHPYPATIEYLEKNLPELQKQGVELVSVSELINARTAKKNLKKQQKDLAKY